MQKQHLIPTLLFIFVLLLSAVSFLYQKGVQVPTTEPVQTNTATTTDIYAMEAVVPEAKVSTEGWKTCRNEEYGWELKYPAEWYVYNGYWQYKTEDVPLGDCQASVVEFSNQKPGQWVELDERYSVSVMSDQKSFSTNIRDLASELFGRNSKVIYILNNEEYLWSESINSVTINVYHNSRHFEISGLKKDSERLETILTTFHFLDTATSSQ